MNPDIILIGAPVALLVACSIILWLTWANHQLHRVIAEQDAVGTNMYEAGVIHGRREATEQYKGSRPWQDGYVAGHHDGYTTARNELIAIAAETDVIRQSGELMR